MLASCSSLRGPWVSSLVELTEEILKLLMELVFRLVRSGELSLARVLRKNILDKVDQKSCSGAPTLTSPWRPGEWQPGELPLCARLLRAPAAERC